jgi:hypothetical protein
MIVLTTSTSAQTFSFIPRSSAIGTMKITDEQTNVTEIVDIITLSANSYVNTIEAEFNLIEGHMYTLLLLNGNTVVYKDKLFCTDQPIATFSVNNGQYISNTTSNEFIVYE